MAVVPGSIAGWRWGNAHNTVASLVLPNRPTSRLMTGHSFAIARRVAPDWVPTSPQALGRQQPTYNRREHTGQVFLCING